MKWVLLIAFVLLVIFGWGAAAGFLEVVAVGAIILLPIIAAYLVYEGIKKREWGQVIWWLLVVFVILKIFL